MRATPGCEVLCANFFIDTEFLKCSDNFFFFKTSPRGTCQHFLFAGKTGAYDFENFSSATPVKCRFEIFSTTKMADPRSSGGLKLPFVTFAAIRAPHIL